MASVAGGLTRKRGSTRRAMLVTAVDVLRERGAAGVTIDEVLARSGAPRGSVYYHFPQGRSQLLIEALNYAGDSLTEVIDAAADRGGIALVRQFVAFWERALAGSAYTAGCPVMAAAISSTEDDSVLATAAGEIFARWRDALSQTFRRDGFESAEAESLAVMCIAALEGAVVLCRSARTPEPLHQVGHQLEFLIKSREFVRVYGIPGR
ncbi:transcriptional regulator, TetR family [Mycolicibacterium fluoranthenivorans]|uniref:Transcriptional regulator, TetR family n=2 Tax=Mycolicibacterium fluoranthenivorans TaxID=258505 RepID=A0A1G4WVS7_9MYCO|nr:transcriptional regulator, TetR family [Mycolicibacterium fluoranthenivorans]